MVRISTTLLMLCFILANVSFAEGVLSGEPYTQTIDIDTTLPGDLHSDLPELGDASQTVMSARDEERIAKQILQQVAVSDQVLQKLLITCKH
jgi:hypothetical protein